MSKKTKGTGYGDLPKADPVNREAEKVLAANKKLPLDPNARPAPVSTPSPPGFADLR